jgi:AcrR family transcriptional regulator
MQDRGSIADAESNVPVSVSDRFGRRRSEIIAAAIPVLNNQGFKGMRLTAVAERIGLRATGVTYYFPRKEELAVACMEASLAVFHELLSVAEREPTAAGRVKSLIAACIARHVEVRRGHATPLASFASIRSLDEPHFERMVLSYRTMFRRVRALFETPELSGLDKAARAARALILLEQLYWSAVFLDEYDLDDFGRVAARMADIVVNGIAASRQAFNPGVMARVSPVASLPEEHGESAKEGFLVAAIRQINAHGYRGASVDRIAASLNLTKGAFYHHNDAKDELVAACFRRSLGQVHASLGAATGDTAWARITTAATELIRFQLSPEGPLLRSSALASMPQEHQREILNLSAKVNHRLAGMVSDAIAEESARPVDPALAAHLLSAAINAASDVRFWRNGNETTTAPDYAAPMFKGLATP